MNIIAILVAALIPMVLGFIWYNPKVFGKAWMQASGMTEEKARQGNPALKYGLAFVFALVLAFILNSFSVHDGFIEGAIYYKTNKTMVTEPGSELEQWVNYYKTNLAADNHIFSHGAFHAFILGLLIIFPVFATNAIFENKSVKYVAINAGYWILTVTLMGGLLAAWR